MASPTNDLDVYWKVGAAGLQALVDQLALDGLPVPTLRYVSTRGEVTYQECECEQAVALLGNVENPFVFGLTPETCGWKQQINIRLVWGQCVNEFVGNSGSPCNPEPGDIGDPCDDPFVPPSGVSSALMVQDYVHSRVAWMMANSLHRCLKDALCQCLPRRICSSADVINQGVTLSTEGSCQWADAAFAIRI